MDDYQHKGLRRKLVDHLREKGIVDDRVLEAIGHVPRHLFIDDTAFLRQAYEDVAFPIGSGQTISQPWTVAFQTALLRVDAGMKVLEIGTGSGYQAAVLARMGARVHSIERQRQLYLRTRQRLAALGVKVTIYHGDGFAGLPREAPFDRVLVTCGAPFIPPTLVEQMKPGGRMVVPVGAGEVQRMTLIQKDAEGRTVESAHGQFRFVPMLQQRTG